MKALTYIEHGKFALVDKSNGGWALGCRIDGGQAEFVSRQAAATLFHIGLATPASSLVQITLCGAYFLYTFRKQRQQTLQ